MILDSLEQSACYLPLSPYFEAAFAFLKNLPADAQPGRYDIVGNDVYALVQHHRTRLVSESQYEVHRRYLDVQYIQHGREIIWWSPLPSMTEETMSFDPEKDAALYRFSDIGAPLPVTAGQFAIFYPADAHIPSCAWNGVPDEVRKVVVKVRIV